MIGRLCAALGEVGPDGHADGLRAGVVVGIDRDPKAKVTLILFSEDGRPRVVAKVARERSAESALLHEYDALCCLTAGQYPSVNGQLPRPLLCERISGHLVLATTALAGSPMTTRYYTPKHVQHPRLVRSDLTMAGEWLARLRAETASASVQLSAVSFVRCIEPVVNRYRRLIGWTGWEEDLFTGLVREADRLDGIALPMSVVHGDYAIGNILVDGDRVSGVVDWERARMRDIPLYDVFKLVASYSSYLDRAAPARGGEVPGHAGWARAGARWPAPDGWANLTGYMYGFFGEGWFPELVRGFVADQTARIGVPPETARLFLPVFVADQATALDQPFYRRGYRALLRALADLRFERGSAAGARWPDVG